MEYIVIFVGALLVGFAVQMGKKLNVNPFAPADLIVFHDDTDEDPNAVKPPEQHLNEAVSRVFNRI